VDSLGLWPIAGFRRPGHDYPKVLPDQYPNVLSGSRPHRNVPGGGRQGPVRSGPVVSSDSARLPASYPAVDPSGDIGLISWK
jgi:hypothetical protein